MSKRVTAMIVDDDETMRMLLENALADAYQVHSIASGEACLAACARQRPDIILLDVDMPGLDGYETCRQIRKASEDAPPVIFISNRDRLEDRLQGYDAGGEDYILKPVAPDELLAKVVLRLKVAADQAQLQQRADYASTTAMTAMNSLGEMGVLLQALQNFNNCTSIEALAKAVVKALSDYSLTGMVRLRTAQSEVMHSTHGAVSPIEMSIIDQVAKMGRIVEYRSRMSISYDHVVLLVSNTPPENDDRRGRLRDHLAILAEAAEATTLAKHRAIVIEQALRQVSQALVCIQDSHREMHVGTSLALQGMSDKLEKAFLSAALSERQENHLTAIIGQGVEQVRQAMQVGTDVLPLLDAVIKDLSIEAEAK